MKTIEYNEFTIKANFHNKGNYILLRIEKVWEAKDKANPNFVETIIEFGQTFSTEEEVEKFKSSSFFNVIYCAVLKEINKELDKIIDSGIPFEKSIISKSNEVTPFDWEPPIKNHPTIKFTNKPN